jgi:hypothetical protein
MNEWMVAWSDVAGVAVCCLGSTVELSLVAHTLRAREWIDDRELGAL